MFGPHKDSISLGATPERAWFCAQYIQKKKQPIKKNEFYDAMCIPEAFGDTKDYFNATYNVLLQLGLIEEVDNQVKGTRTLTELKTADDFRRYAARKTFQWEDSLFFKITSCYCAHAEEFLKCAKKEDYPGLLETYNVHIKNYNDMLSWRLWAPYLGCGYLNKDYMIPNWHRRIADLLYDQNEFKIETDISIAEFVDWLKIAAPETKESFQGTQISLGISNGLRTLHELETIQVISLPDAAQWQMINIGGNPQVSHIRIRGVRK